MAHCSLDVAFIDLGMDTKGKSWAKKRGLYIDRSTHVSQFKEKEPPAFLIKKWKEIMQGDISIFRPYWFAKPLALCCTPFQHTLYLDVDCEVKAPLEDVFLSLEANDCALCQESFAWHELLVQQGLKSPLERTWNSGVIAYHCHCPSLGGFDAQYDLVQQLAMTGRIPIIPIRVYAHSSIRVEDQDNRIFCGYIKRRKEIFQLMNEGKSTDAQVKFHFDYITQKGDFASELGSYHTFLGYSTDESVKSYVDFELRVFQPYDQKYQKKQQKLGNQAVKSENPEVNLGVHFNRVEGATEKKDFEWLQYESPEEYNKQANNSLEKYRSTFSKFFDWIFRKSWKLSRFAVGRRGLNRKLANHMLVVNQKLGRSSSSILRPQTNIDHFPKDREYKHLRSSYDPPNPFNLPLTAKA